MNENPVAYYYFIRVSYNRDVVGESHLWRWAASRGQPHSSAKEKAQRWKTCLLRPALDTEGV